MTSKNSENTDFIVTPTPQINILTQILDPISCQLRIIAEDQLFVPQRIIFKTIIPQQYLDTAAIAVSKFGKKVFVVGDSHVKGIKPLNFNKEFRSDKTFFRSFSDANSKQLNHYIIPTLVEDKPDVGLLHVGINDILSNANDTELANGKINIGLDCKNHGFSKVFI